MHYCYRCGVNFSLLIKTRDLSEFMCTRIFVRFTDVISARVEIKMKEMIKLEYLPKGMKPSRLLLSRQKFKDVPFKPDKEHELANSISLNLFFVCVQFLNHPMLHVSHSLIISSHLSTVNHFQIVQITFENIGTSTGSYLAID